MSVGVNIFISTNEYDDLFLQGIFTGVIFGGCDSKNIEWNIVLPLSSPLIHKVIDLYRQYNDEKLRVIFGTMIMAMIGFFISKSVLIEIDYFIVNAFMGYAGMKLLSKVL